MNAGIIFNHPPSAINNKSPVVHPVGTAGEFRLVLRAPLGNAGPTGPIDIMIGRTIASELSAPAFLRGIFGVVQPAHLAHQMQERRRIPLTHPRTPHSRRRVHSAQRSVVLANVRVDPREVRNRIRAAEHALVSRLRVDDEQSREILEQPIDRIILMRDLMDTYLAEEGLQLGSAARILYLPNGLRYIAAMAPG